MTLVFVLLLVYQVKHFLADFPLQTPYMLKKFLPGWEFVKPLAAHAAVHSVFTLVICLAVHPSKWWLALVDFGAHFIVDRIKASPQLLGRFRALSAGEYRAVQSMANYEGKNGELLLAKKLGLEKLRSNTYFWLALGGDQFAHHVTHYFIIYMLVS